MLIQNETRPVLNGKKQKTEEIIRAPAAAGAFYSADKNVLSAQIDKFLSQTEDTETKGEIKMLIVPHAGYDYSGQVAAYGFKKIIGQNFKTVILIGPSHTDWFDGVSVYKKGLWQTPLGKVEVDSNLTQKLISENEKIFSRENAHKREHCLEVELPFLQKTLKNFSAKGGSASGGKIVPIIMGSSNPANVQILADALGKYIDKKTLIIISSDLSHYPSYEIANKVDSNTIRAILTGQIENFEAATKKSMSQGYNNLVTCACGAEPIKVGLILAGKLGLKKIKLLKYMNSGDITGNYSQVVGYAAISFAKESKKISSYSQPVKIKNLEQVEKEELLKIARQSIETYLKNHQKPVLSPKSKRLSQPQGAFVTLKENGQLRGCIGTIIENKIPLYEIVSNMAIAAATEDPRFEPVKLEELKNINIEISVLSPLKKIKDPFREINLGKDGVIIKKDIHSGVFLPQVATETGWNLEKFMGELCSQKANLPRDAWKKSNIDIYTFTANIFKEENI